MSCFNFKKSPFWKKKKRSFENTVTEQKVSSTENLVQESAEVEEVVNQEDSDSEDEWNFIKGDETKKGLAASQPETVVECSEEDAMSQLNPNAAEFVPVSPTRSIPSPACRTLINDEVIAQSPKQPVQMDIKIPNENDFENEVKSRPSEVDAALNGHSSDSEFLPSSIEGTPTKTQNNEEFHFGPNSAPFTPKLMDQSEAASSTRAVYGDESNATLDMTQFNESQNTSVANKENTDPMSMSFSEERGDTNPFSNSEDLNKVHILPNNLDEFLSSSEENKENIHDFTISDLPEHHPLGDRQVNNDDAVKTTDLDQESEKELASPIELELDQDIELSKTPQPTHENLLGDFEANNRMHTPDISEEDRHVFSEENKEVPMPTEEESKSESLEAELRNEVVKVACHFPKEVFCNIPKQEEDPYCPLREDVELFSIPKERTNEEDNGVFNQVENEVEQCPVPKEEEVPLSCPMKKEEAVLEASFCEELFESPRNVREIEESLPEYQRTEDYIPQLSNLEENIEVLHVSEPKSPTEDVTSSVKDDVSSPVSPVKSPENEEMSRLFLDHSPQQEPEVHHDLLGAESESLMLPKPEACPLPSAPEICPFPAQNETCPMPTNLNFNTEPLIPNDQINHFLQEAQNQFQNQMQEISEQIQIKTDNIVPEFAQQEVITPSDESKGVDVEVNESPSPAVTLAEPPIPDLICPMVKEEPKLTESPKIEAADQKKEVKEEVKKSATKKPLNKAAPSPKTGASAPPKAALSKTAAPKVGSSMKTSTISPRVPSKTGTTGTAKPPVSKTSAPTLSSRTTAAPKPKTSPTARSAKPSESKPLLNGDIKNTASRAGLVAKKPIDSKTTTRPAAAPRAPISRPPTASKVSPAAPKPTSTTARPASGVTKTASTTAPKLKPAVSSTRTTTTTKSLTSTLTSKVSSSTSKTTTLPKTTTTSAPKPKTITSAPKLTRVPLTKTITKNAELEKQNKESANTLTASKSTTATSTRTANSAGTRTNSTAIKKTETKPLSSRTAISKTSTTTTKSTVGKKPGEIKSVTKTKTTKVEKPKENGISATIVTEEITMVNNVVNDAVNNLVNSDNLVNNEIDSDLLKDNSPIDNKLIDNLIGVNGTD